MRGVQLLKLKKNIFFFVGEERIFSPRAHFERALSQTEANRKSSFWKGIIIMGTKQEVAESIHNCR